MGFDELVLLTAGSKLTASSTVMASTTTEITSASHLDAARSDAGSRITTAAPTIGTTHSTVNHGNDVTTACTARIAPTTSNAPANIDSA